MATLLDVPRPSTTRGFTLLELACVVTVISILVSLAVPNYRVYRDRALAAEATVNIETIAYLEQVTILERGAPVACPPNPAEIPAPTARFAAMPAWQRVGFAPEGKVRFQYRVETKGEAFTVVAVGDVDQDGVRSEYRIDSATMAQTAEHPGE